MDPKTKTTKQQRSSLQKPDLKHAKGTCEAGKISTDNVVVEHATTFQSSIPHDIIINILSRLPVKSLARFRCVCKHWFSLTYDAYFVGEQQKKAKDRFPQILSCSIIENKMTLFSFNVEGDIEDSSFEIGGWNRLVRRLSNSVNGLACGYGIQKTGHSFYLLNPSTREYSKLPMCCRGTSREESFGFGYDSSSGEYKLVRIFYLEDKGINCGCEILTLGTAGWRYIGEIFPMALFSVRPVLVNERLYWMAFTPEPEGHRYSMDILSFDVKHEEFEVTSPPDDEDWRCQQQIDIKELEGHLCVMAIAMGEKRQLRIWKLMDNTKWVKMYYIDLDYGADLFGIKTIIGTVGKMLMLEVRKGLGFAVKVFCYDLQKGTLHQILQETNPRLMIHKESLVSPRKLLRDLGA